MTKTFNRARMTTATTGTGTVTLGSAVSDAFATFAEAGVSDSDTLVYCIEEGNDFEIGRGTYTASGTTLSRDTVLHSKISGTSGTSKMNLGGAAEVFIVAAAEDIPLLDTSGNLNPGTDDGGAIGTTSLKWSDAFFASGAVINFASGDVTITHSSGLITVSGDFDIGTGFFFNATDERLAIGDEEYAMTIGGSSVPSKFSVHTDGSEANAEYHTHDDTAGILGGALIYGARSRGSEGSETVVQNADFLMALAAVGHDGTDYAQGGRIDFVVDGTPGDGDMPTRINFRTSADGSESPTLRFSIRADGTVEDGSGNEFHKQGGTDVAVADGGTGASTASGARTNLGLEIGTDVLAQQTIGIANDNLLEVDGSPNSGEFARFTANGLEGRTASETRADLSLEVGEDVAAHTPSINAQTGTSYTGVLSDEGKVVTMDNASANTFTIPANSSVAYPTGTIINVIQKGAGTTTIAGDTGVTLNGVSAGSGDVGNQYGAVALIKIATDTWIASGNIGTVA